MATYVFRLPDVGEGTAEAEIVAWHADVGDEVTEGAPLVDVMTEKATVEIDAPVSGRITARRGKIGDMAPVGATLVEFETDADEAAAPPPAPAPAPKPQPEAKAPEPAPPPPRAPGGPVEAAPAVRTRARALAIDLTKVRGSGPGGRIEHADLDALLTAGAPRAAAPQRDEVEEIKIVGLRRKIAERMQESKRRIPHFSYVEEVDVTALEDLRRHLNDEAGAGRPKLTVLPFLALTMVRAIPRHPGVNAHFDDEAGVIRRHAAVHLGIAAQTPGGLMVPVLRHAETLDLWGIAAEIGRLAAAARDGKASREELSGSTITISSLGPLGGIAATPIVNPPEVAIVGVNRVAERPMVRHGRIEVRRMMNLSSSFDHRVVDGWDAAAFIQSVKALLEAPATLFLER